MVQRKLPTINSAHGTETRNIINELIKLFNGMGYTYNEALQKAESILTEAQKTNNMNENVQEQINTLVAESGTSDAEVLQARVDEEGTQHAVLKERLDKSDLKTKKEIQRNDDKSFYNSLNMNRHPKPMIVFVDDDGYPDVYEKLKPVAEEENIPIASAVITGRIDNDPLSMTLEQIKECQNSGMEIVSHTHTHQKLSSLTPEEQDEEIFLAKDYLRKNGFNHDVLVYPFGAADATTQMITERYHSLGVYIDYGESRLNYPPILQYRLERVYLNNPGEMYVQRCKDKIDEALSSNGLLVIGMHCFYDGFSVDGLKEVISYAKSRGIEISTFKKALENFGNIVHLPGFKVDANGDFHSEFIDKYNLPNSNEGVNGSFLLDYFKVGTTVTAHANADTYIDMPVSSGSVMFTHRPQSDWLSFQEVFVHSNKNRYIRTWSIANSTWNQWEKVYPVASIEPQQPQQYYHDIAGSPSINGTLGIDYFKVGTTVSTHSNVGGYTDMPVQGSSVMKTYKPSGWLGFSNQEVTVISSKTKYIRFWNVDTNSWNAWEQI